jgi:hypothetical protein
MNGGRSEEAKRKLWGEVTDFILEKRKSFFFFEGSQAIPARLSDKDTMKMKTL